MVLTVSESLAMLFKLSWEVSNDKMNVSICSYNATLMFLLNSNDQLYSFVINYPSEHIDPSTFLSVIVRRSYYTNDMTHFWHLED